MGFFSSLLSGDRGPSIRRVSPTTAASAARIHRILNVEHLQSMPTSAARAFALASDPNAMTSDFVSVIECDEALTARIIRIANSAYFSRGAKASDVEKAVTNIGLDELKGILTATMLKNLVATKHPLRNVLWGNSIATALFAKGLSRISSHHPGNIHSGEAFLCGIVHDVGKLVMLSSGPSLYKQVIDKVAGTGISFVEAEEEIYGLDHLEVGKWVAQTWNFPQSAFESIAFHHEPWPELEKKRVGAIAPAVLIKAADTIAHSLGLGFERPFSSIVRHASDQLPEVWAHLGISASDAQAVIESLREAYEAESVSYSLDNL